MSDLSIYESGVGGDVRLLGQDLELTDSWFNMVYLGLFGGNPEASTTGSEIDGELRNDFYGNSLFHPNEPELQFNSITENILNNVALDSAGRVKIEDGAKKDLEFLKQFAEVSIDVFIVSDNRVQIDVTLNEPSNLSESKFRFIWDGTRQEIIDQIIL